jgi:zinc D-Ala-D-Ala dipeptidase
VSLLFPVCLLALVILIACTVNTPWEGGNPVVSSLPISRKPAYAKAGLIRISEVDPTIAIDLRYIEGSTIANRALYPKNMPALLRPETAVRLKRANELVKQQGYRILVWDAYRPPEAQIALWDASGHDDRFVANPFSKPSQHSCGTAVDVTLITREGKPVEMPTGFDSFTPEAAAGFNHPDPLVMKHRGALYKAMKDAGFKSLPNEWWHFSDSNSANYPDTIPLSAIESAF